MSFFQDKKVLIAGGTGLVGRHLFQRLKREGANVVATRFSQPENNFKKYDFSSFDDCLEATKNKDIVYICAVQASGIEGMKQNPTSPLLPNLKIHAGLLEACAINEVERVVWVSSSTVFHESYKPQSEEDLDLNKPLYPSYCGMGGLYRYLEQLFIHYHRSTSLKCGVVRTSSIYGPYDSFEDHKSHVIPALIKRACQKEKPFIVWGNGYTVRDFVYVEDLVQALVMVTEKYCCGEPINFSNGEPCTIREATNIILDICNHRVGPVYDEDKLTAIPYRVLCNDKFCAKVGTFPRTSFREGIRRTVQYYLKAYKL